MRDPKRILKKLIGPDSEIGLFDASGESLEQLVETLRDVAKCRKIRDFIKTSFRIDLAVSPEIFYQLLEIARSIISKPRKEIWLSRLFP